MPHSRNKNNPPTRIAVHRIGTEPMTVQHREQALTALACLIAAWQHHQSPGAEEPRVDSAIPLPLPRRSSDTDQAA